MDRSTAATNVRDSVCCRQVISIATLDFGKIIKLMDEVWLSTMMEASSMDTLLGISCVDLLYSINKMY